MSRWGPQNSALLSLLLDDVTGNEEAVAIKQDFCRLLDTLIPFNVTSYYTGSKAEGLDLPGSDKDFMFDINDVLSIKVVQSSHEMSDTSFCNVFLLCTENLNPGFAFLCDINQQIYHPLLILSLQCMHGVRYLSSDMLISNFFPMLKLAFPFYYKKRQGPSMAHWHECRDQTEEDIDQVCSIHCQFWPNDAKEWIRRPRHYGWPTFLDISTIVDFGCHLVPVGHPNSEFKTLEWRISFSVAERTLVWSFNHVQLQCYAVMKIILKEFIKKKCSTDNQILCSYFIKTFLFWKYEETDLNFWRKRTFRECIKYLLNEFCQCIHNGVLRHYFLPKFNLLSVKLTREAQSELLQLFDIVIQCDISILKECRTLQSVWSKVISGNDNQMAIIHNAKKNNLIRNDQLMMEKLTMISVKCPRTKPERNDLVSQVLNRYGINIPFLSSLISELIQKVMPRSMAWDERINRTVSLQCKTSLKSLVVKNLHLQKNVEASELNQSNKTLFNLHRTVNDKHALCDLSIDKLWYAIVLLKRCDYTSALGIINQWYQAFPNMLCMSQRVNVVNQNSDMWTDFFIHDA